MVKLNKIYTRTGDDGTTGLVRGPRIPKHDIRVEAFGSVDETNAILGMCRIHSANTPRLDSALSRIQNDLFDLGADLATPGDEPGDLRVTEDQVTWLEERIDHYNGNLEPLTSFVLPGGSPLSTHLHLARTVSRRAERVIAALVGTEPETNIFAMHYMNRLSDLLFVLARVGNGNGAKDVLWQPGRFGVANDTPKADET